MGPIAEADALVRAARRRLTGAVVLRGVAHGVLVGSLVGAAFVAIGLVWTGPEDLVTATAVLPVVGALVGAILLGAARPSVERAALALDRAAGTEEAFLSSVTAEDARPDFRELSARYALERCDARRVAGLFPMEPPSGAARAAVALAVLAALLLVPEADAKEFTPPPPTGTVEVAPPTGGTSRDVSPEARARALLEALEARTSDTAELAARVRGDLPGLDDEALADLARVLADGGSEAARQALAELARGDREAATQSLLKALGGDVPGEDPSPLAPSSRDPVRGSPDRWSAPSWPLRYDRTVRRWLEARSRLPGPATGEDR